MKSPATPLKFCCVGGAKNLLFFLLLRFEGGNPQLTNLNESFFEKIIFFGDTMED